MLVTSGYKHLRLDPKKSSVLQVQKAIRQTIDKLLLSGKRLPKDKTIDLGTSLGAAWGHAFCKALKWNWRVVTRGGKTLLTITPPDRAYIIGPIGFVTQQLQKNPPEVNTSLLLFQMAKAGSLAKAQAGAYLHIG
jgi:hypothetical protein